MLHTIGLLMNRHSKAGPALFVSLVFFASGGSILSEYLSRDARKHTFRHVHLTKTLINMSICVV